MKKSKRVVLFLESLENRVVPSNTQVLLDPHHAMGVDSSIMAELETPKVEMNTHEAVESHSSSTNPASDDMASSASNNAKHQEQSETKNHGDTDHASEAKKNSENESDTNAASTKSNAITSSVESAEDQLTGSVTSDVSKKANLDSDSAKSKGQTANNGSNDKLENSSGSSLVDKGAANSPKSDANQDSGNNGNGSKAESSSPANSSSESSLSNSSSSADNDSNSAGNAISTTTTTSPTVKNVHGKSQSDQKDSSGNSGSTDLTSQSGNSLSGTSPDGIVDQVSSADGRLASALSETNSARSSGESTGSPAIGLSFGVDGNTASISSVAAALSAKGAVTQLPAVADFAIPLAIPALESLAPNLGLGDWAAIDSLAPVAGDLIVGFLPVEQLSLVSSMQGVLNQIDDLGEQIVGSSAGKWLYPIVFTALAATTVFQLASRRRRQFQRQSVWASESGIWSPTYYGPSAKE